MSWGTLLHLFSVSWEYTSNKQKLLLLPKWWIRAYTNISKHSVSQKCNGLCCAFLLGFNDLSKCWHFFANSMLSSLRKEMPTINTAVTACSWMKYMPIWQKTQSLLTLMRMSQTHRLNRLSCNQVLGPFLPTVLPQNLCSLGHFLCFQVWWVIQNESVQDGRKGREGIQDIKRIVNTALERTSLSLRFRFQQ